MVALPVATRPIDVISPSMLERLACPARVAFGQLSSDGGGQSAAAAIGSAMHEAMVTVINGGSVEAAWDDAIGAVSLPTAVDVPRKVKRAQKRFVKRADEVLALLARYPAIRPCIPESEIMSACGEVRGTPDLVWFGPNGAIVVDYKSGVVQSGNQVSGSYIQQIQLYSALVAEKHDVEIDAGWLFSMKQGAVEVDVSPETRAAVFAQAKARRAEFNDRVGQPQTPVATEENCQFCPFKARCAGFWTATAAGAVNDAGRHSVRGFALPPVERSGEVASVSLEQSTGEILRVCRIPTERLGENEIGFEFMFTGLNQNGCGDEIWFEWGPHSQFHRVTD